MIAEFYVYETKPLWMKLRPRGALRDAPSIKSVVVTVTQENRKVKLVKTGKEVIVRANEDRLGIYLTQEETALFAPGIAVVQANVLFENLERDVSSEGIIRVKDNQYKEVIS